MPARPTSKPASPRTIASLLEPWFIATARGFPWRPLPIGTKRDPWRSLVSELMLQQTQTSRVAERFEPFMRRFPTPSAMAKADESEVLAAWSGLGFYRRARLLHAAAREIVSNHQGRVPDDFAALLSLPGVGKYTAGAIASMVFDQRHPIVDGNVNRVLLRLHAKDGAAGEPETDRWAWEHATRLVRAAESPGVLNEALMELGATVCTPKATRCDRCPMNRVCGAHKADRVSQIPRPKERAKVVRVWAAMVVHLDRQNRVLLEQRPAGGMWSSMWQLPTLENQTRQPTAEEVLGFACAHEVEWTEGFIHKTTHREVHFSVWIAGGMRAQRGRVRVGAEELGQYGLSNPQRRVIQRAFAGSLT